MDTTPHNTDTTAEDAVTAKRGGAGITIAIIAVILVALIGGAYAYYRSHGNSFGSLGNTLNLGSATNEPVARVNGTDIVRGEYDKNYASLEQSLKAQGTDTTAPEIQEQMKKQVIDSLVNEELLFQTATKAGYSSNDEDVQKEYDSLATQLGSEDALKNQMAAVGLTEEALRADISRRLTIQAYLLATVDPAELAVTDEEVKGFYDSVQPTEGQELPPFEDVSDQIKQQLASQKEQEAVAKVLETLRADASIEVLI